MSDTTTKPIEELREKVASASQPSWGFFALVLLSTTIAAYGLLANSTAVVIGAMLVAPLMGPIFGVALALVRGDRKLVFDSAVAEASGVALVLLTAFLIGLVPLRPEFGSEILARTSPTVYDIIVALASGAAGAYAQLNKRIEASIAGVAIATALVPPLTASGLCFAAGMAAQGWGAFLLFAANFLAIELAAAGVFAFHAWSGGGYHLHIERRTVLKRFGWSAALLLLMTYSMTKTLVDSVGQKHLEGQVRNTLADSLGEIVGAQVDAIHFERKEDRTRVVAVILTPVPFDSSRVASLEDHLRSKVSRDLDLIVRSLSSKDADRTGAVYVSRDEQRRTESSKQLAEFFAKASEALREGLGQVPGATLEDLRRSPPPNSNLLHATVSAPEALGPEQVARLRDQIREAVGGSTDLVVRTVLAKVADHDSYLYEPARPQVSTIEAVLRQAVTATVNRELAALRGSEVKEVRLDLSGDPILCYVTVECPRMLLVQEVAALERALSGSSERPIRLLVRVQVAGNLSSEGPTNAFR